MDRKLLNQPVNVEQVILLSELMDIAISSDSYEQLCKRIVHEDITQGLVLGSHLYSVDSNLDIELKYSYGKTSEQVKPVVSGWDDSPVSKCVMAKQPVFNPGTKGAHLALPLARSSIPIGVLFLVMGAESTRSPIGTELAHLLSKIGAFFIEVRPLLSPQQQTSGNRSVLRDFQLSTRQVRIVQLIAQGLTNGKIGRDLALSESTIRQETIKIYKALGATGRDDAVILARKLGIVQN